MTTQAETPPITVDELFEDLLGYSPAGRPWEEMKAFIKAYNDVAEFLGFPKLMSIPGFGMAVPAAAYDFLVAPENAEQKAKLIQFVTEAFETATAKPLRVKLTQEDISQAERAYYSNLRAAGMYPTKTPEFEAELAKRFQDILGDYATGRFGDMSPQELIHTLTATTWAGAKLEPEFTAELKEKQKIGEKFDDAWQRLLSTQGIDVPEELRPAVKAVLGKAFVDAAYQNPATTKAETVIVGNLQSAIEQAQTQRQAGFREDALAQFMAEGDYDRAARLVGPPPTTPATLPPSTPQEQYKTSLVEQNQNDVNPASRETEAQGMAAIPTFNAANVVRADAPYRAQLEDIITSQKDPGYGAFLRKQWGTGPGLPSYFSQAPEATMGSQGFQQFIGREFERLQGLYQRSPEMEAQRATLAEERKVKTQAEQAALAEEDRQSRSFRTTLLTRRR